MAKTEGRVGQIIQNKVLAAEYAEKTRKEISNYQIDNIRDYSQVDLFEGDTYTVVVVFQMSPPEGSTLIEKMGQEDEFDSETQFEVSSDMFSSLESSWSVVTHPAFSLLDKLPKGNTISIDVSGSATVSEAYEIKEVVRDLTALEEPTKNEYKLVNTGTIERWFPEWGIKDTTYIKDQYERPVVSADDLRRVSERRLSQAKSQKIVVAGMGRELKCFYDSEGEYLAAKSTSIIQTDQTEIAALINSKLASLLLSALFSDLGMSGGYITIGPPQLRTILSYLSFDGDFDELREAQVQKHITHLEESKIESEQLNTNLLDYLGDIELTKNIGDFGLAQPADGVSDSILSKTQSSMQSGEKLKIGQLSVQNPNKGTLLILATAKFKPDDPDEYSGLNRGYTETEPVPALRLTGLSDIESTLIEAFLPVVSDRKGGFAGYYANATKTISLIDRIKSISFPDPNNVESELNNYSKVNQRYLELENKIDKLETKIDQQIYSCYDLTEEDIELIESVEF